MWTGKFLNPERKSCGFKKKTLDTCGRGLSQQTGRLLAAKFTILEPSASAFSRMTQLVVEKGMTSDQGEDALAIQLALIRSEITVITG